MEISYNRLFKLLIDKGMKKTELAKVAGLTPGTLAKLSKNQTVSMDSLIKICTTLDCSFDDIVEIINNKEWLTCQYRIMTFLFLQIRMKME